MGAATGQRAFWRVIYRQMEDVTRSSTAARTITAIALPAIRDDLVVWISAVPR